MTQKAGQKCTAIRRVLVPPPMRATACGTTWSSGLRRIVVGNPALEGVRMGPVATGRQLQDVREGVCRLARDGRLVFGSADVEAGGRPAGKGFFAGPVLLEVEPGAAAPPSTRSRSSGRWPRSCPIGRAR